MAVAVRLLCLVLACAEAAFFASLVLVAQIGIGDTGYDSVCWERAPGCLAMFAAAQLSLTGFVIAGVVTDVQRGTLCVVAVGAAALAAVALALVGSCDPPYGRGCR